MDAVVCFRIHLCVLVGVCASGDTRFVLVLIDLWQLVGELLKRHLALLLPDVRSDGEHQTAE